MVRDYRSTCLKTKITIRAVTCVVFFVSLLVFPAQLVRGYTLSDLLAKPWSQTSSLLPPRYVSSFLSRTGFTAFPLFNLSCSSICVEFAQLALSHSRSDIVSERVPCGARTYDLNSYAA